MSGLPSWFRSVIRQTSRAPLDTFLMSGLPSLLASSISTLLPDSSQVSCSMTDERTPAGSLALAPPDAASPPQPRTVRTPVPIRASADTPTFHIPYAMRVSLSRPTAREDNHKRHVASAAR